MKEMLCLIHVVCLCCLLTADCGRSQYADAGREQSVNTYIAGGWEARVGEFPWQVNFRSQGSQMCGGVLINRNWVVTAAHCTEDENVADLDVALADHRRSESNANRQIINVDRVVDHENYDSEAISDDISLLHLQTPATLNNLVQPACKPDHMISYEAFTSTVSGWGRIRRNGPYPDELRYTSMNIVDDYTCYQDFQDDLRPGMMCAGNFGPNPRETCSGDSGGPLAVKRNDRWDVVGLTSWGYEPGCGENNVPGVYVRVSHYEAWIDSKINAL